MIVSPPSGGGGERLLVPPLLAKGKTVRTYHMPMPFGWFQVAWSDDVPVGTSVPLVAFGKHLAAWRDDNGEAHVWDAFCPHLGAHFGHRAQIKGDSITCALHGGCTDPTATSSTSRTRTG